VDVRAGGERRRHRGRAFRIADRLGLVRTVQIGTPPCCPRFMPLLGLVAERYGPRGALEVLAVVPVIAMAVSWFLREPIHHQEPETRPPTTELPV
jgi:hypothetical protein